MKILLIAEKPNVSKDIKKVYEKYKIEYEDEIHFASAIGHLVTLAYPEEYGKKEWEKWSLEALPIIPINFMYIPVKRAETYLNNIKSLLKKNKYDLIINACDAGREGELIFTLIYEYLNCKIPVKRLWLNELTEKGIKEALNNLKTDEEMKNLKLAAKYRQWFDWLVGINLTRVVALKTNEKISVGRVMTPTLAIVVSRELEIREFKPTPYWEIETNFKEKFSSTWLDKDNKSSKITEKNKAEMIINKISKATHAIVKSVENKENTIYPASLHDLGDLQKESNKLYGYSLSKTLDIAQSLYEKHKLITYPRTDSKHLNKNVSFDFKNILNQIKEIEEVKEHSIKILKDENLIKKVSNNKVYIDDSKVTDHHAIIPTQEKVNLSNLDKEQLNVYLLIVKRFLSIFMPPYKTNSTIVLFDIEGETFKTESKTLIDLGYKILYENNEKEVLIPNLKINQKLEIKKINLIGKQTKTPSRYTDASLLSVMESASKLVDEKELQKVLKEICGIGTPSTRAGIFDKLIKLGLIEKEKKNFIATDLGIKTIKNLNRQEIISPSLTAIWEFKLKQLECNRYNPELLYKEIIEYTKKVTNDFINIDTFEKNKLQKKENVIGKCPKCSNEVISGKKYYRCKGYKEDCDFIFPIKYNGANINIEDAKNILANKKTKPKTFEYKNGNTGRASLMLHPETKNVVFDFTLKTSKEKQEVEILGVCPKCNKNVVITKNYYMCQEYKKSCDFIFPIKYNGTNINKENAKRIVEGKETKTYTITFNNKKVKGKLTLKNGKLYFIKSE